MRNNAVLTTSLALVLSAYLLAGCESEAQKISRFEQRGNLDGLAKIGGTDAWTALDRLLYERIESRHINRVDVTLHPQKRIDTVGSVWTPQGMRSFISGHWEEGAEDVVGAENIHSSLIAWLESRRLWTDDLGGVILFVQVRDYPAYSESYATGAMYTSEMGMDGDLDFDLGPPSQAANVYDVPHSRNISADLRVLLDGKEYTFGNTNHEFASGLQDVVRRF